MSKLISNNDDLVQACPECDVAGNVYRRTDFEQADDDKRFRCGRCNARFDEIVEREAKGPRTGGKASKYEDVLAEMDPEELVS